MKGQIFIELTSRGAVEGFVSRCVNQGLVFVPQRPVLGIQPIHGADGAATKGVKLWLQGEFVEMHNHAPTPAAEPAMPEPEAEAETLEDLL